MLPFDLHVLSIPPAFNLSHDQTLQFNMLDALASYLFDSSASVDVNFELTLISALSPFLYC